MERSLVTCRPALVLCRGHCADMFFFQVQGCSWLAALAFAFSHIHGPLAEAGTTEPAAVYLWCCWAPPRCPSGIPLPQAAVSRLAVPLLHSFCTYSTTYCLVLADAFLVAALRLLGLRSGALIPLRSFLIFHLKLSCLGLSLSDRTKWLPYLVDGQPPCICV